MPYLIFTYNANPAHLGWWAEFLFLSMHQNCEEGKPNLLLNGGGTKSKKKTISETPRLLDR